ncbi:class I adenylate-forming enzyme family protein [Streptomyces sp. NPDC059262]|uniref:class I adenylate-forming enzyme family protein n=1 Tax=Streptomyces sp. NPDC059262 TaxID=3346797 RepID=UPI0036C8F14F
MNLTMLLDMAVEGFPKRVVVGRSKGGLTAMQLRDSAAVGAALIRDSGAAAVVFLDVNGPAFPVALFAAARAGVPLVPLNYRLGERQLRELLAHHPKALAIAAPEQLELLDRSGVHARTAEEWLAATRSEAAVHIPDDDSEAPAVVIYTSGTTSAPKGVLLRHHHLVSYVLGSVEFASAAPEDAALMSVPPYHIAAVANVITNLYAGRRCIVLERFTPGEWVGLARDEAVTNAMVVPTMLARIVEQEGDRSVPTLRTLAYGGAPMPSAVIERALRLWPDVGFVNAYGLTETSSTIAVLAPEDHREALASADPAVRARLSSVGRVVPAIELEIRDTEGRAVGPGVTGRICVRGEQVSAEYAGAGRSVDNRGFFDTRDQGHVDGDGYLFIGGRIDDTIIRGGENIAPAEIEDVLMRHPAVLDAAVVGVPDDEWGQRIEAAVVVRAEPAAGVEELRGHVRAALRSSKTPDRIVCWDELPRTPTGKLLRREVAGRLKSPDEPAR